MPPEEFHRYWLEERYPLARRLVESLRARRYVQTHTVAPELNAQLAATRDTAEAFDGLAEVWWDSLEDLISTFTSDEGQEAGRALINDEAKFIDFGRSSLFRTEDNVIWVRRARDCHESSGVAANVAVPLPAAAETRRNLFTRKRRWLSVLVRPGRLELPRALRPTRPSTLRVYQFRHRRVTARV
jgi:hypothetical protein